jgi:hypothetical protein
MVMGYNESCSVRQQQILHDDSDVCYGSGNTSAAYKHSRDRRIGVIYSNDVHLFVMVHTIFEEGFKELVCILFAFDRFRNELSFSNLQIYSIHNVTILVL